MLAGSIRLLGNWANRMVAYRVRREAIKALGELDDRALRYMGIARCCIESAATGASNPELGRLR
jgi:uncharacterized protein YjiS (DUF1127 family)